jgi:hypothetical protein
VARDGSRCAFVDSRCLAWNATIPALSDTALSVAVWASNVIYATTTEDVVETLTSDGSDLVFPQRHSAIENAEPLTHFSMPKETSFRALIASRRLLPMRCTGLFPGWNW